MLTWTQPAPPAAGDDEIAGTDQRMINGKNEDRLARGFNLFFLLLPLACWPMVFWQFTLPKAVLVQLFAFLALFFWVLVRAPGSSFRWGAPHYIVAGFLLWIAVSSATALTPAVALLGRYGRYQGLLTYGSYAGLFFLASQISWLKARRLDRLFYFSSIGLALVSGYAIIQSLGFDPIDWGAITFGTARVFSTFGNPNFLGSYLALSLPPALALYLRKDGPNRFIYGLPFILGLVVVVITFSRAAWLSAMVGVLIMVYLERNRLFGRMDRRVVILPAAGIAVAVLLVVSLGDNAYLAQRFQSISDPGSGSFAERIEIWKAAVGATGARPLLGFGPDNFGFAYPMYLTEKYVNVSGRGMLQNDVHNYLLGLASTSGVPAALLFLAAIIAAVRRKRGLLAGLEDEKDRVLVSALVASVIAYLVNILLTVNPVGAAALFWVMLGILAAGSPLKKLDFKPAGGWVVKGVAGVLAAAVLAAGLSAIVADWRYKSGLNALSRGDEDQAEAGFNQAIAVNPFVDAYPFAQGKIWLNRALAGKERGNYDQAAFWFETALSAAPYEPNNHIYLGQTLLFAGQRYPDFLGQAIPAIKDARRLQPRSPTILYLLAAAEYEARAYAKAEAHVESAIDLDSNYPEAFELLGMVSEELGHRERAVRAYETAVSLDPGMEAARARLSVLKK